MKKTSTALLVAILLITLLLSSCDDSGVNHSAQKKGIISFTQKNLKRLNPDIDGVYELWLRLDTPENQTYYSLGKFNIGLDGRSVVDLNDQSMKFQFNGDTNLLYQTKMAVISIEGVNPSPSPSSAKFLSVRVGNTQDSIWGKLTVGGELSLNQAGVNLYSAPPAYYTLQTPSRPATYPECAKGVWFASTNGDTALIPSGLELTPGNGWVYEAWVADTSNTSNPIYYSMGRFYNPRGADADGAGSCAGVNPGYNTPGQDWVQASCPGNGKPDIINLTSGYYQVFITVEPEYETSGSPGFGIPFYFKIYRCVQNFIYTTLGCNRRDAMPNVPKIYEVFPEVTLHITN